MYDGPPRGLHLRVEKDVNAEDPENAEERRDKDECDLVFFSVYSVCSVAHPFLSAFSLPLRVLCGYA